MKVAIGYFEDDSTTKSHVFGYELNGYYSDVAVVDVNTIEEAVKIAREKYDMTWGILITETGIIKSFWYDVNVGKMRIEG